MLRVRLLEIDPFKFLFDSFLDFIEKWRKDEVPVKKIQHKKSSDLWERLLMEDRHDLIKKLQRVERREGGFSTIVVPENGFSKDTETHDMVLTFLKKNKVNVLDVNQEISDLKDTLQR